MLWRIGLGALILGIVFFVLGFFEWRMSKASSAKPEEISLKALIARGPKGNPNIILKDFRLCDNLIYETRPPSSSWNKVWVPVVPADEVRGDGPIRSNNVRALIFSLNVRNERDLESRCNRPALKALVTNSITSLGSKEKKLLEQSYPGTDFSTCLIIQEGREPAGPLKLILMVGGGGLATLVGAGLLLWSLVQYRQESAARTKKRKKRRPVVEEEADEEEEEEEPRPKKRRPVAEDEDEEEPRPRKRRPVEEDDEDEPRPRRRR